MNLRESASSVFSAWINSFWEVPPTTILCKNITEEVNYLGLREKHLDLPHLPPISHPSPGVSYQPKAVTHQCG